ncbi:MAG: hypothetical protein ACU84Q_07050 [Gammaproteobacteria bacterium]
MAGFSQLLSAPSEELVRFFYKVRPSKDKGFIATIDDVAKTLGLNHSQLVCGLGFNFDIADFPDVYSIVGFTSDKSLFLRRDELFRTDIYRELCIDDIIDIYSHRARSESLLDHLQTLTTERLNAIENHIAAFADPNVIISYKMELHAIYNSDLADENFAEQRMSSKSRELANWTKIQQDELKLIIDSRIIPASNLFFSDTLTPEEKLLLIESGEINVAMIKNRMQNTEISPAERDMLEDKLK